MSSKQKRSAQEARRKKSASKKLLKQRAKLKSYGLLSKRVDLRRKPTSYQKKLIARYQDVLRGKAQVVSAATPKQAAKFKHSFQVIGDKIVVPRGKGEKIKFSKKTGELRATRTVGGKKITKTMSDGELAPLLPGQYYVIEFAGGQRFRTNDFATLQTFMQGYEKKEYKPFKDWRKYVQIETLEDAQGEEIAISKYRPIYKRRKSRVNKTGRNS